MEVETCPFSKTPNSFIDSPPVVGEAPREDLRALDDPMIMLALRLVPFALSVGELTAEDLLEIRGIFVGVSLDITVDKLSDDSGGPSFASRTTPGVLPTTEGEPAMVGSWCLRNDVSDCFCIELTV